MKQTPNLIRRSEQTDWMYRSSPWADQVEISGGNRKPISRGGISGLQRWHTGQQSHQQRDIDRIHPELLLADVSGDDQRGASLMPNGAPVGGASETDLDGVNPPAHAPQPMATVHTLNSTRSKTWPTAGPCHPLEDIARMEGNAPFLFQLESGQSPTPVLWRWVWLESRCLHKTPLGLQSLLGRFGCAPMDHNGGGSTSVPRSNRLADGSLVRDNRGGRPERNVMVQPIPNGPSD
jgi:hypothetical protein